ncbi:MAG: hypothetical protein ABIJ34_00895 [archaeon]
MKENDKTMLNFMIAVFVIGMVNLLWAIAKSMQSNWSLFNVKGIDVLVAYGVSLFLLKTSIKELSYYMRHKKIEHGYDERNMIVLHKSLGNTCIVMLTILMGAFYYFYLFYDAGTPIFSLSSFNWLLGPALIVFLWSFNYYYKSKNI